MNSKFIIYLLFITSHSILDISVWKESIVAYPFLRYLVIVCLLFLSSHVELLISDLWDICENVTCWHLFTNIYMWNDWHNWITCDQIYIVILTAHLYIRNCLIHLFSVDEDIADLSIFFSQHVMYVMNDRGSMKSVGWTILLSAQKSSLYILLTKHVMQVMNCHGQHSMDSVSYRWHHSILYTYI